MTKDTVNIHGKEYETVASRVKRFRDKYKEDYAIVTRLVSRDDATVVMKASILKGDQVIATGYAEEVRTSSQINRTSALENAETSAIGRALAAFGMAGTEYASADEVAQAISQQNAPIKKATPGLATPKQREFVAGLLEQNGVEASEQAGFLVEQLGLEIPLTFEGAQFAIEELKKTASRTPAGVTS